MKITRSRTLRINMGNYEHVELTGAVEMDFDEGTKAESIVRTLNGSLDRLLEKDLQDAIDSSALDSESSFVYSWNDLR